MESTTLSGKTKRAAALPPDERRSMIVAATLPLILEHGDRVTSRQIAEAAGIAEGTIFRAFADKDEIIVAVVEAALDQEPLEAALTDIPADMAFEAGLAARSSSCNSASSTSGRSCRASARASMR